MSALISAENLGGLVLHLAREHRRARRMRAAGLGSRYLEKTTALIRELLNTCHWPKRDLLDVLRSGFEVAALEGREGGRS